MKSMYKIRLFWWRLFELLDSYRVDEAVYQVYLACARDIFAALHTTTEPSTRFKSEIINELQLLKSSTRLTTGLSLERLWKLFRPRTVSNYARLQNVLQMETLADRFDELIWTSEAPLTELSRVRDTLGKSIAVVMERNIDGTSLGKVCTRPPPPSFIQRRGHRECTVVHPV